MSEFISDKDPLAPEISLLEPKSDPSLRREHFRQLLSDIPRFDESHVPDCVLWLQDSWSEIRKDCAKWIRLSIAGFSHTAEILLFNTLLDCIQSGTNTNSWQAVHGSVLGLTELIKEGGENNSDIVQILCLGLVGSSLAPIREAATACISKLVTSKQISTAILISTILNSLINLYGNGKCSVRIAHK